MVGPAIGPSRGPRRSSDRMGTGAAAILRRFEFAGQYGLDGNSSAGTSPYTFVSPATGILSIYATGGAGAGANGSNSGGGGASGLKRNVPVTKGDRIEIAVGNGAYANGSQHGTDTKLTLPDGSILTAGGGKSASTGGTTNGIGGAATGFDLNSRGGDGGATSLAPAAGQNNGGAAGGASGSVSGGGGAGGFGPSDEAFIVPGAGADATGTALPVNGGGGAPRNTAAQRSGGPGRVLLVLQSSE